MREIERGSKVRPYQAIPSRVQRILADTTLEGYILANDVGNVAMGQWEVILIDVGEESGLLVGHELDIYRKREATEQVDKDKVLILPDIDLGDAIVLEAFPHMDEIHGRVLQDIAGPHPSLQVAR